MAIGVSWLLRRSPASAPEWLVPDEIVRQVEAGAIPRDARLSADGGRSWVQAACARGMRDQQAVVGVFVPGRVAPWAMVGQWISLLTLLFFGGPISALTPLFAYDPGPSRWVKLAITTVVVVLGPLPVFVFWWLGKRERERDPSLGGGGRLVMILVIACLMAAPCVVSFELSLLMPAGRVAHH